MNFILDKVTNKPILALSYKKICLFIKSTIPFIIIIILLQTKIDKVSLHRQQNKRF